jgi:hypothetical protein
MLAQLVIGIMLVLGGLIYGLAWTAKQRRHRPPIPQDVIDWGVPVNDPESAIGGGWFVELDGRPIAELTEPRCQPDAPFWLSYVVVPLTEDPKERAQLFTLEFWHSGKAAFRSRKFGVLALGVFISGVAPCPRTHRIIGRGFRVELAPQPHPIAQWVRSFLKRFRSD